MLNDSQTYVGDFEAVKAPGFNRGQQLSSTAAQRIPQQSLGFAEFNSVQQGLESGSGPGGRRFKSSFPDQSFHDDTSLFKKGQNRL